MAPYKVKVRMDTAKITAQIQRGIRNGVKVSTERMRDKLMQSVDPAVYVDRGGALSKMLALTGLDKHTKSNALLTAWKRTITEIKTVRAKQAMKIRLFDSTTLDRDTIWMGLSKPPLFARQENVGTEADKWRDLDRTRGSKTRTTMRTRKLGSIVQNGYRPLPSAEARRFVWRKNPYSGNGYWLLYEQGYTGRGVSYKPSNFIHNAYHSLLGNDVARMFSKGSKLKLNTFTTSMTNRNIVEYVNIELRK